MRLFVIFGVFLTIISTAAGQDRYTFDCNRLPNSCKNGGTCESGSKECVCTADWTGYNCNHPTASTPCTTESDPLVNPCQSSGTCYKSSDQTPVALCYCKYGYYGDTCEEEIAKINCTGNIAEYSLSFPVDFIGSVVLVDENGTSLESACPLFPSGSDRKTYALAVDITDAGLQEDVPCKLGNIMVVNETTYQANLRVSYRPSLVTNLDEDYILNCEHTTEDVDVSIDIENVIVNDDGFGRVTFNESYLPIELEVTDVNGSDTGNVLVLGERTLMHVYPRPGSESREGSCEVILQRPRGCLGINENERYTGVLIETCTANNYLTNENETMSFKFLDRGCPTEDGNFISAVQVTKNKTITTEQGSVNVSAKAVAFSAFKFSNSDKVKIECKAKVCRSGDSSCDLPNCSAIMNEENSNGGGNTTGNSTNGGGNSTSEGTTNGGGNTTSQGDTNNGGGTTNGESGTTNEGGTNNEGATNNGGGTTNGESGAAGGNDGVRRKRAAGDDETEEVVSKVFTVVGKREIKNDQTSSEQEAEPVNPVEECLARPEITAVVAVLGAVVCVLLIVCFFLVCVILKRKGKHTTTYDPTLFQPKPDRFQIPRAHVNESYEMM